MKKFIATMALSLLPVSTASAMPEPLIYGVQFEEFEVRSGDEGERMAVWNFDAVVGTDEIKFRWLSEGEYDRASNSFEGLENRFVAQVPVSDFFDVKAGVRVDTPKKADRWYGVLGLTGLAPQWIEVDADVFISEKGKASARIDAEYELLFTNHLILTASADLNVAFSDDAEIEIKSGFSKVETGLRLSYDVVDRSLSPYVGTVYERKLGGTADLARNEGEDIEAWFGVVGLKMAF